MPKGPSGQKRPADAIARAVMVARIAIGELSDEVNEGGPIGKAGGDARHSALMPHRRAEIARTAAQVRWSKYGSD